MVGRVVLDSILYSSRVIVDLANYQIGLNIAGFLLYTLPFSNKYNKVHGAKEGKFFAHLCHGEIVKAVEAGADQDLVDELKSRARCVGWKFAITGSLFSFNTLLSFCLLKAAKSSSVSMFLKLLPWWAGGQAVSNVYFTYYLLVLDFSWFSGLWNLLYLPVNGLGILCCLYNHPGCYNLCGRLFLHKRSHTLFRRDISNQYN